MSIRTLIHAEKGDGTPLFDTIARIAQKLDIYLDSILFPESNISAVPKCVVDFFSGMSAAEAQIYIDLCQQANLLKEKKRRLCLIGFDLVVVFIIEKSLGYYKGN